MDIEHQARPTDLQAPGSYIYASWFLHLRDGGPHKLRIRFRAAALRSWQVILHLSTRSQLMSILPLVSLQYEPRPRLVLGKPPSPRGYHEAVLADSRLFLFGGFNGYTAFDDVSILDLAAGAYLPQVTSFTMGSA